MAYHSYHLTVTGSVTSQVSGVVAIYAVAGAALSSVALKNGSSTAEVLLFLDIPAGTGNSTQLVLIPTNGIAFKGGVYATVTGTPTGITIVTTDTL